MYEDQIYPVTLMQIHIFLTLAECRNFSKTAGILQMTQPGVSKSIARLEDILGFRLLSRTSRKVELTETGMHLSEKWSSSLKQIFSSYEQEVLRIQEEAKTIRIGIAEETDSDRYFWNRMDEFQEIYPDIELQVEGERMGRLLPALKDEIYDCVFVPDFERFRFVDPGDFNWCYAAKSNMRVIASLDNPIAARTAITFSEVMDHPIVIPGPEVSPYYLKDLQKRAEKYGKKPIIGYQSKSNFQTRHALRKDSSLLYLTDAYWDYRDGENDCVDITVSDEENGIICVWNEQKLRPVARKLVEFFNAENMPIK